MNYQVLLVIESGKFLLSPEEAFQIAAVLNACSHITSKWAKGSGSLAVVGKPNIQSAVIVPVTAHMQLEWDANEKECEK